MNDSSKATSPKTQGERSAVLRHEEILSAASSESPEAFSELYALYSRRLYNTIYGIVRDSADAEDVLQETFLRVHVALREFEGRSSLYCWLTRIAINCALMSLRKRRTRSEVFLDLHPDEVGEKLLFEVQDPAPSPEQVCHARQVRFMVLGAVRKLSPHLRAAIEMRVAKGASMKEISLALNISVASVKARLHRARKRLLAAKPLKGMPNGTARSNASPLVKSNTRYGSHTPALRAANN